MSFIERLLAVIGMKDDPIRPEEESTFSLKELPDGRLRFLTISTNNYPDRKEQTLVTEAHKKAVEYAEKDNAWPELWPWHMAGQRLGVVDWMDFDGNFLLSSGLIDEGMETKAKAWASDPNTAMSHGFFRKMAGNDIVEYLQFEQSVLPRWAACNPFTDFTVGVKDMALTPQKRAELAEKGYTDEELTRLETYTDTFRQKLAAAGVSFKDIDDETPAPQPTPAPAPQPAPAPAPAPEPQPVGQTETPVTLEAIRQVVDQAVEARMAVATKEIEDLKGTVATFKGDSDAYFASLWEDKTRTARLNTPSRSPATVVPEGAEVATKEDDKTKWVEENIPILQHPFFQAGAARVAAGRNGQ